MRNPGPAGTRMSVYTAKIKKRPFGTPALPLKGYPGLASERGPMDSSLRRNGRRLMGKLPQQRRNCWERSLML